MNFFRKLPGILQEIRQNFRKKFNKILPELPETSLRIGNIFLKAE